jgi:diguanylate cyclase (GGDEF)-like protein
MTGVDAPAAVDQVAKRQGEASIEQADAEQVQADAVQVGGWRAEFVFALLLFMGAVVALWFTWPEPSFLEAGRWQQVLFFLFFSLFTISIGFPHPVLGHVSFDRVAQVSSILVLGPVDAAWVALLTSLVYPLHRLRQGVPPRQVIDAALTNSGLMALVVLGSGWLYVWLGGPVPLATLDLRSVAPVLLLIVVMQVLNELGMAGVYLCRRKNPLHVISVFETLTELVSGLIAALVAIVYTSLEMPVFVLLLVILSAGMLGLKQFAEMRLRLEQLVEARTVALQDKTDQLEQMATRDMLTGLRNRRYAEEFLEREVGLAHRSDRELSVALADIDHFKQINDGYSHAVGDRVLQKVSRIFDERVRSTDLIARYGGEEFLFCFIGCGEDMAGQVCEDLRRMIDAADWSDIAPGLHVTVSIGVVGQTAGVTAESMAATADARLYRAKHMGRNLVVAETTVTNPSL